jgi:hypothetical protein
MLTKNTDIIYGYDICKIYKLPDNGWQYVTQNSVTKEPTNEAYRMNKKHPMPQERNIVLDYDQLINHETVGINFIIKYIIFFLRGAFNLYSFTFYIPFRHLQGDIQTANQTIRELCDNNTYYKQCV